MVRGSRFNIYLPAVESAQEPSAQAARLDLPMGNGELILMVDDENSIREIAKEALPTFGYQVLTASDGTEALALFAQQRNEVQCVITDMMMPFMDLGDDPRSAEARPEPEDHRHERL